MVWPKPDQPDRRRRHCSVRWPTSTFFHNLRLPRSRLSLRAIIRRMPNTGFGHCSRHALTAAQVLGIGHCSRHALTAAQVSVTAADVHSPQHRFQSLQPTCTHRSTGFGHCSRRALTAAHCMQYCVACISHELKIVFCALSSSIR